MNPDNRFELLGDVVFEMSTEIGGIGPKSQDLVIYFHLVKVETLPQLHFRYLQSRSNLFLLNNETGQINNLTGKYIMKITKLKQLKCYMTKF